MKDLLLSYYGKYRRLKSSEYDVNFPLFCLKSAYYHLFSKNIFAHHSTTIKGLRNIETRGRLFIGTAPFDLWTHERTRLDIRGKLVIEGDVSLGKGCHVIVHEGAICTFKDQCNITGQTNLNIGHRLEIGRGTTIAWGCEFLDRDGHFIEYDGKKKRDESIVIGDNIWIGSHVKLLKGVHVSHNSVIAAGSLLTRSFTEENVLIAGNPAKIIRRNVKWH